MLSALLFKDRDQNGIERLKICVAQLVRLKQRVIQELIFAQRWAQSLEQAVIWR